MELSLTTYPMLVKKSILKYMPDAILKKVIFCI